MKILIAGDFVVNTTYSIEQIENEIIELFKEADYNIVNLEAPVTDSLTKIIKTGPNIKSNRNDTRDVLRTLKIDAVTIANNHILDFSEKGVEDTLSFCNELGIQTVGAGMNKSEASKTFYLDTLEGVIAIINIAENEWASATDKTAGANGMDLIDDIKKIQEAKNSADFVFVIVHGGHEYYNLPSLRMQKQYRFYVDNGADLIVGHHTHCISGKEIYQGKNIYYSLGNFLFTSKSKFEDWYQGIVLEVNVYKEKGIEVKETFIEQNKSNFGLTILKNEKKLIIEKRFEEYSNTIKNSDALFLNWSKFLNEKEKAFKFYWSPITFLKWSFFKKICYKLGINGGNKEGRSLFLNLLNCEAHRDISKDILKKNL